MYFPLVFIKFIFRPQKYKPLSHIFESFIIFFIHL
ncbi:hypothetical protein YPPY52_4522, partial [Yersinia pestis PY-52]